MYAVEVTYTNRTTEIVGTFDSYNKANKMATAIRREMHEDVAGCGVEEL